MIGDRLGLDGQGKQRAGMPVAGSPTRSRADAVELQAADVADAGLEPQASEIEDPECGQGLSGGIGGVLGDRQVVEDFQAMLDDPSAQEQMGAAGASRRRGPTSLPGGLGSPRIAPGSAH
ncbi:MAG: hypothetical protein ACR2KG_04260 [Nocardioidaceae bacterium]